MEKHQQQVVKNKIDNKVGYDYVEIEIIIQEVVEKKRQKQDEKKQKYEMSAKYSGSERRNDRKRRKKSWINIDHAVHEYSVADNKHRISY